MIQFASWRVSAAMKTLAVVLLLAYLQPLSAQTQARLTGTVGDNTGAVIPGAAVTLRNLATGVTQTAETSESGLYNFPYVAPGSYELRVEFTGFKTASQTGITLDTGFTRTLDVAMEIGELSEVVTVEASTPLLESETSSVGQFIERETVFNMPVQSRRSASLVRLMGNVVYRSEDGGEQIPKFSMAGGRANNQMWTLDGSVVQNMALGVAQLALNPPAESLQEFKAEQSNYSAEYGRAGGGFIVMTTRSGTNTFHGAAYEFFRNDAMDSRSFFAPDKAPLRYNIFGGSLGGPIAKDKTFFFFNYEGSLRRNGVTYSDDDVPHIPEKSGDFSNRANFTLKDPLGGNFANNTIPQSRIDPLGREIIKLYPNPNLSTPLSGAPANNFVNNASNILDQSYYTTKVDHNLGDSDRISGRFVWVEAPEIIPAVYTVEYADPRAGIRENQHWNLTTNWIHNFSPSLINEFRFNWGDRMHINRSAGRFSGANGQLGVKGVNQDSFAQINVNGLTSLAPGNQERIQTPIRTIELVNNQTWIRGKHQVKYGFNYRFAGNLDDANATTGGSFSFGNRATGVGTSELLLGHVNSAALADSDLLHTRIDYYGIFVQEDWKVSSNLTLNLGMRWELDTPRREKEDNRQSGFNWTAINPVNGLPGVVTFSGRDGLGKYAHNFYKNAFGPRFGFAYKATDGLVLRGGYGINYYGAYKSAVPNTMALGFSINGSFASPDAGLTKAFQFSDGMPVITRDALTPAFGAVPFGANPVITTTYMEPNHRTPMAQQWNFGVQKQLPNNLLAEVTYMANMGHRLGGPDVNWNQIPLVNGRGPASATNLRRQTPFPQFNGVNQVSPSWGNSSYHALNVKMEKRFSGGLNFLVNFTHAKMLDDVESNADLGGEQGNGYQHYALRQLDKSFAGNDIRSRLVGSVVYELPLGKGKKWNISNSVLNAIAGGWGLGVIAEFRDGAPFGVIENTNLSNTFSSSQRSNIGAGPQRLDNWRENVRVNPYFDREIFSAPGAGVFGSSARNYCCGPGFVGIDTSVHKWFSLTEQVRMQFRADFYNLPNIPAFANPDLRRGVGNQFGVISSTALGTGGRVSQLALRVEF